MQFQDPIWILLHLTHRRQQYCSVVTLIKKHEKEKEESESDSSATQSMFSELHSTLITNGVEMWKYIELLIINKGRKCGEDRLHFFLQRQGKWHSQCADEGSLHMFHQTSNSRPDKHSIAKKQRVSRIHIYVICLCIRTESWWHLYLNSCIWGAGHKCVSTYKDSIIDLQEQ